jgi:hypothetical protein
MIAYRDIDGDSGVLAYDPGPDYIRVQFKNTSRIYCYSYQKAGKANVETMKELARNGNGLNSFINRNVKYLYD